MKWEFILSILSLLSIVTSTINDLISLEDDFEIPNVGLNLVNGLYEVNIKSGKDKINDVYLVLDTASHITWIPSLLCTTCDLTNRFDKSFTPSFKDLLTPINIPYLNGNVSGALSSADFYYFQNETLIGNGYTFVLVNKDTLPLLAKSKGAMGFGHTNKKNYLQNSSFTNLLIKNKQIEKNIISIDPKGLRLYVGGLPFAISQDMQNYTHCSAKTSGFISNYWSCLLTHYIQGDSNDFSKSTAIGKYVIFDTGAIYSCVPLTFFNTLWTTYFMNKISCTYTTAPDNTISITCTEGTDYTKFDNLHFLLNGWAYNITPASLFVKNLFTINFGKCIIDDAWIFGNNILQNFQIVFDRDKDQVGFYTDRKTDFTKYIQEEVQEVSKNKAWIIIAIIVQIIFLIIIIVAIVLVIKKYKQKRQFDLTNDNMSVENLIKT